MSETRSDNHRPSVVDPSAYEFLGAFYLGDNEDMAHAYRDEDPEAALADRLGFPKGAVTDGLLDRHLVHGNFRHKGTCDHCGARFLHGVYYFFRPKHEVIAVGHTCAAETFSLDSRAALVRKRAEKAAAAGAEARKVKAKADEFKAAHAAEIAFLEEFSVEHEGWVPYGDFYADVLRRIERWGDVSERTIEAVRRGMVRDPEIRAKRLAEKAEVKASGTPVPERRLVIVGEVLSVKWKDSHYGGAYKMLVKDDRGFKVWGTRPDSLAGDHGHFMVEDGTDEFASRAGVEVGDRIRFTAATEPSHDDEFFGFFKRPTKAEIVKRKEVAEAANDEAYARVVAESKAYYTNKETS